MTSEKNKGDSFGGVEELYREVILDHFKAPRNKGKLTDPTVRAEGVNPLCGDQITVTAVVDKGIIKDIKFEGQGCAISQSSASMMTAAIKGKTISEAESISGAFKNMFGLEDTKKSSPSTEEMGDLEALEGVKKYPVRIKCAVLSWNTLQEAFKNLEKR